VTGRGVRCPSVRTCLVGRRAAACLVAVAVALAWVGSAAADTPPGFIFTSTPIPGAQPPGDASSAADAAAGTTSGAAVVLFAGDEGETWVYDTAADSWSKQAPSSSPDARSSQAMAPAPPSAGVDRALLYGGFQAPSTFLADTWVWNDATKDWGQACSLCVPGALARAMMAASPTTTLLVDGSISSGFVNAVWRWDDASSDWVEVHPSAPNGFPAPRGDGQFAFDGTNFVLYGGLGDAFQSFADTWLLIDDGGGSFRWEPVCSQCPPGPRSLGALTPMGGAGTPAGAVLVGGELIDAQQQPPTKYYSDTWFWDGTARSWLQLVPGLPLTASTTDPNVPYTPSGGSIGGATQPAAGIVVDTRVSADAEDPRVESNILRWQVPVPPNPPSPPPAPPPPARITVAPRFTG
jgi:hypothetical protein